VTGTSLYAVGLFALPLLVAGLLMAVPVHVLLRRGGVAVLPGTIHHAAQPGWRTLELLTILLLGLEMRYLLYRSGGGTIPLHIGEFESLALYVISEIGGWVVFALGYGVQHRRHYGALYSAGLDFASSFPSLLATGLFLVSPYVAIMTLGLNAFGVPGLYVGALPVGAAHILLRTLTLRRSEIERQNLRLQKMNLDLARSERMAAIGQMSSAISHQMLQKVGLLGLQCDLLREGLHEPHLPRDTIVAEARERVEQLDASITDLDATLSDLLVFSREFALHLKCCAVDAVVGELIEDLRAVAAARGVTLCSRVEGTPAQLTVDRMKLKQALLNVLTNAIEASPPSGRVEVVTRHRGEGIQIAVSDQGPGVAAADMDRLFTPFFTTKEKGTGLGLSFAQKIVELHKGTITLQD
jgi:signal transduction histidine kinase